MKLPYFAGGNATFYNHFRKQTEVSQNITYTLIIWCNFLILGICPGEIKTFGHTKLCTQIFIEALFLINAEYNPNVQQQANGF